METETITTIDQGRTNTLTNLSGKYLTFTLGSEIYGLEILRVQEIIGVISITRVPKSQEHVKGVINLRGKIIPVIDLRLKLGMPEKSYDKKTCFVVVNTEISGQETSVGVVVDTVVEVINVQESNLQPPPEFGADIDTSFILAMSKISEDVVTLIDIVKALKEENHELSV